MSAVKPSKIYSVTEVVGESPHALLPELMALLQRPDHVSQVYWFARRCFDVSLALLVLIVGMPALITIVVAIKLESKGPVFFKQSRVGQHLRIFGIFKFRTMFQGVDSEPVALFDAESQTFRRPRFSEDPRVTKMGRMLRRFSFDELPQVLNILSGDMSFIGPRPLTITESLAVPKSALCRYSVPAGITGLAQIRDRHSLFTYNRFDSDIEYTKTVSLRVDFHVFCRTFRRMHDLG